MLILANTKSRRHQQVFRLSKVNEAPKATLRRSGMIYNEDFFLLTCTYAFACVVVLNWLYIMKIEPKSFWKERCKQQFCCQVLRLRIRSRCSSVKTVFAYGV